jgi:2-methylisocitrate lyase-like PEP mutase family enzyme
MPIASAGLHAKAEELRRLHHELKILVLPNAWDVTSARLLEDMGFSAVATSSAAVANSLGYPDGQHIGRHEMLEVVGRIASAVQVPVTADMEAGYATTAEEMEDTARELLDAGAVGLNLEDSSDNESALIELPDYLEKLRAICAVSKASDVPIVINARTDAYWWKGSQPGTRLAETVRRANAFREAGADCVFVPGLYDPSDIAHLRQESPGPINILATAKTPPLPELQRLGVARVSFGSGGYRTAMGAFRKLVQEAIDSGTFRFMSETAIPSTQSNALHQRKADAGDARNGSPNSSFR